MQNTRVSKRAHFKHLPRAALAANIAGMMIAATASVAGPMPKEAGVWFDDSGKGAVKIEPCGSKLCGRIVWLKNLVNDKGEPLSDRYNPEAGLRTRPICGLQILGQLDAVSEGGFDNGWIYDPKEGKSYSVAIALSSPDELSVTGYKGVKLFSKTFIWKRAKTDLPSCATGPVETKNSPAAPASAAGASTGAAVKSAPAKAPAQAAATPATAAPAKAAPARKPGSAEALPWGGDKAAPTAQPASPAVKGTPGGASNLGAPKPPAVKSAVKPAATKTVKPAKTSASAGAAQAKPALSVPTAPAQ